MLHVATVFAPLIGALITGLGCRLLTGRQAHLIACAFMAVSAACAVASLFTSLYHGPEKVLLFEWIALGSFESEWTLRVDALTGVMFFVVAFVSFLIHVYSLGYMEGAHDPHIPRFMCYISMFTFFMLMLVCSDSLVQLFFGWEGVGLASYLLIGFWFKKKSANDAAIKAFVVNRVGDFGFALGIMAVFYVFGSIQFDDRTNTLIINDLPEFLTRASDLIATLDRPEPQVEIEARIVQTSRDFARNIGVQWGTTARAAAPTNRTPISAVIARSASARWCRS